MAPKSKEFIVSDSHDSSDEESKPKAKVSHSLTRSLLPVPHLPKRVTSQASY
jgi:hypothetical protein